MSDKRNWVPFSELIYGEGFITVEGDSMIKLPATGVRNGGVNCWSVKDGMWMVADKYEAVERAEVVIPKLEVE